jgi:phosphoribosylanthranilate isomerase
MTTLIKICGITNLPDAMDAVELGVDFLGFNFYDQSPRFVDALKALKIIQEIPEAVGKVGVFVNCDAQLVIDIATDFNLDLLQFHGDETPEYCRQFGRPYMKALRPQTKADLVQIPVFGGDYFLIDAFQENAYGGTGKLANWDLATEAKAYGKMFLSGGLNIGNLSEAIRLVAPYAVDIASGSESAPGKKDYSKMEKLIKIAKGLVHEV